MESVITVRTEKITKETSLNTLLGMNTKAALTLNGKESEIVCDNESIQRVKNLYSQLKLLHPARLFIDVKRRKDGNLYAYFKDFTSVSHCMFLSPMTSSHTYMFQINETTQKFDNKGEQFMNKLEELLKDENKISEVILAFKYGASILKCIDIGLTYMRGYVSPDGKKVFKMNRILRGLKIPGIATSAYALLLFLL